MATIQVTISTYFDKYGYRNNTVLMEIPEDAAELIKEAWLHSKDMNQSEVIKAKYLATNQNAKAYLIIDGITIAGIIGMPQYETQDDTFYKK